MYEHKQLPLSHDNIHSRLSLSKCKGMECFYFIYIDKFTLNFIKKICTKDAQAVCSAGLFPKLAPYNTKNHKP